MLSYNDGPMVRINKKGDIYLMLTCIVRKPNVFLDSTLQLRINRDVLKEHGIYKDKKQTSNTKPKRAHAWYEQLLEAVQWQAKSKLLIYRVIFMLYRIVSTEIGERVKLSFNSFNPSKFGKGDCGKSTGKVNKVVKKAINNHLQPKRIHF